MRIQVDPDKCQGHNRCKAMAPELFELDDFGYASAAVDGIVAPGDEASARLTISNCPEFAIKVIED